MSSPSSSWQRFFFYGIEAVQQTSLPAWHTAKVYSKHSRWNVPAQLKTTLLESILACLYVYIRLYRAHVREVSPLVKLDIYLQRLRFRRAVKHVVGFLYLAELEVYRMLACSRVMYWEHVP